MSLKNDIGEAVRRAQARRPWFAAAATVILALVSGLLAYSIWSWAL